MKYNVQYVDNDAEIDRLYSTNHKPTIEWEQWTLSRGNIDQRLKGKKTITSLSHKSVNNLRLQERVPSLLRSFFIDRFSARIPGPKIEKNFVKRSLSNCKPLKPLSFRTRGRGRAVFLPVRTGRKSLREYKNFVTSYLYPKFLLERSVQRGYQKLSQRIVEGVL